MPHIRLPPGIPGIRALFQFRATAAAPLLQLAEMLLRDPAACEQIGQRIAHLGDVARPAVRA